MIRLAIVVIEAVACVVWALYARALTAGRAEGDDRHTFGILARLPILALLTVAVAVGTRIAVPGPVPWQLPVVVLPFALVMLIVPAVMLHDENRRGRR